MQDRSFTQRLFRGLSGLGAGLQSPTAGLAFQQQIAAEQAAEEKKRLQQRELQERQQLGNILAGGAVPAFAQPGGAEPATADQRQRATLGALAELGTPEALQVLGQLSPAVQAPARPMTEMGRLQADIKAGFVPESVLEEQKAERARKTQFEQKKLELQERQFEQKAQQFERGLERGGLSQEDVIKRSTDLRKEFTGLSKEFIKQRDAFNRIQASVEDPSAAGDLSLIFNYMKLLDPGSVVRESEFATAQNAAGVPERIRAQYNNIVRGERLTDKTRNDFLDRSDKLFKGANKQHEKRVDTYRGLANRIGADPNQVIIDLGIAENIATRETGRQPSGITFLGFE